MLAEQDIYLLYILYIVLGASSIKGLIRSKTSAKKLLSVLTSTNKLIKVIAKELTGAIKKELTKAIAKEPIRAIELIIKDLTEIDMKLTNIEMLRLLPSIEELARVIKGLIRKTILKRLAIILVKRFAAIMPALSRVLEVEFFRNIISTKQLATKPPMTFRFAIFLGLIPQQCRLSFQLLPISQNQCQN